METEKELRQEIVSLLEELGSYMTTLDARQRELLLLRYGILDGEKRSLEKTGEHYGITKERTRQIEDRAFEKMAELKMNLIRKS